MQKTTNKKIQKEKNTVTVGEKRKNDFEVLKSYLKLGDTNMSDAVD